MMMLVQILLTVALVAVVIWLTTIYWQRDIRKMEANNKAVMESHTMKMKSQMEKMLQIQMQKENHLEQLKQFVHSRKQNKTLKSKVDFLTDVLREVQRQCEDANISKMSVRQKKHFDLLKEMVSGTIELLHYEELRGVERIDTLVVNTFCQEVFENCEYHVRGEVDLRLETELEDDETVCTNKVCLRKVLTYLLVCAMQFTDEGEIVMEVRRWQQKKENYLRFAIKDSGQGIPEEVKDVVFDRITGTDIENKVIGVRLRLCKALSRLLGGSIYLEPLHEKGTSICLMIRI